MPTIDVDQETPTAFEFGQTYLFKQHFNKDDLFQQLQGCYVSDRYWFEVSEGELSEVKQILDSFSYELKRAAIPLDYCVVQDKKGDSSEILRNSVATHHQGEYEIFLMEDKLSARQAVEKGAIPIQKSGLSLDQMQWKTDGS